MIEVRAPFPWTELLRYLAQRATPSLESIDSVSYRRGNVLATFDGGGITVEGGHADRISAIFHPNEDTRAATRHLAKDSLLKRRLKAVPGFRPLGAWSPFELCVRTIIGQQVSVAGARTLMARLVERAGSCEAADVAAADFDAIGMPGARVRTIRTFAEHVASGDLSLDRPWPELNDALAALPGFGPWTRAYLGIRLGRDPDAFPASDLGLIRAAGVDSPKSLERRAEAWRPFRALAATYLWAVD